MLPLPKGAAPKFILLFLVSLLIKEISSEGRVVCYYTNWSVYRPGTAKFNPQNINPYLCTHLIYAFGGFTKDNTLKPFDKYQDIEQGGYSKFTGLKAYNKNLKTLLAIGGWNEGSSRFSPLVASPERRQQFIKNILKFLRQNHFDGLDLDWEYPAFRDGGKLRDKENYAQFVQELRSEFDRESSKTGRPRLLLTMAVPAGTEYIEKGYDIPKLNKYLDWFNLLSYDYHSAYEPSVNHHSPLYSLEEESEYNYDSDLNIDYSVKFYLQAGADRDKLVLGIPTYGRTYTLVSDDITDLGSPADGPGDQGDATREKGYLAYYEICQNLRDDPDWTIVQPNSKAMGPYAFRGNQWVGYDDEAIVKKKAEYVVENGLGGIMFWSIDNDDFRGSCGNKPYPLIEAAKEAMFDRLGLGDNEVARPSPPRKPSRSRSRLGSSNRNNIINESSNTHKANQSGKKSSSRRTSNKKRLNRVTSTTTTTTTTTTPSSLYIGGRSTTPPPPTTPDPGADFKCEEEGFFPHPRDCKKYFWCLDSGPSNLGIVAHQFTCPSGLYFNTAADSCDFSRNVLCKSKTTTAKPTTTTAPITTSTTTRTTTNSPRITAATSRQTFLRHTSTTEQPSEEEYEDDDEDESIGPEEEEDPKVIKELIQLIKKVGGLEELEKQLLQQEDGSMVLSNTKSDVSSTTQSTISKSLYHKVLSRPNNLSSFRRQFETNKLARSTVSPSLQEEEDSVEVEESSKKSDSRYSSVVRNSRPSPQNAGIDKLPEFEGFLKEKPKYVTIQRTRPTVAVESNFDEEENEDVSTEFVEQSTRDSKNRRVDVITTQTTTVTPSYVNIRRTRPSTAAPESSEVTEEEKIISSTKSSYLPLNRRRISTVATATEEVTTAPSTGTPFASTTQRYKYIERTKSSTLQPEEIKTTTGFNKINFNNVDENSSPITVQNLELNEYTTQAPIQKIPTTHIYENIARRTTFSTTPSTTLVETTTAEPTTIRAFTTTNPTTTTLSSSTNSAPLLEQDPTPVDVFQNQNSILPITDLFPNKSAGLDTDGKYTTELITDKKTDKVHLIGEDEVTLTDSKVKVSSSSTLSSYNITKFNEFESSLKATNPSLSKIDKQVTVTSTDKLTTPNTDPTTTPQTTIQKDEITTTKDFLETVSSPRPFGFPRRRTRPTTARKPSSSTNHENVTSTSTVTPPPTQKVSPLKQLKSNSRTISRYQSRTNVENVSSASNNAGEFNEIGKGSNNQHTNHSSPKRPLNTYSYSGENADDELDNSISSRKRSYSWRSQVNRNFRPWKTTTTVGTTPLPNLGPDRTYRPKYGDERDNLETDDSYDYKSYRGESESDSYSTVNKARQFDRSRGNVRTSSDDATSQRRIGVRLRNQGVTIDESEDIQITARRNRVNTENQSAEHNSSRRKLNRVSTSSLSKQDDANLRNRVNIQKSSEDSSSQKRLDSKQPNQGISEDESENKSTNNSNRRKFHRVQSESELSVSTKNIAGFERSRGSTQIASEDANSQKRFEIEGDIIDESEEIERGNRRYGVQTENQATDNNSNRKFYRVQSKYDSSNHGNAQTTSQKRLGNQGVIIGGSEDIERGNRRYGQQTENDSTDNSNSRKFHRVQSQSGSSLLTQDDENFERSRGNFQISSDDTSSQRRIGVKLQTPSVTIDESEEVQRANRTENQFTDTNSNLHKSMHTESQSDLSLSSKDATNFERNRGDFQASSEDIASQKRIESESASSVSSKHDSDFDKTGGNMQISSEEETSQKKVDSRLRNATSASEDTQTQIQSSDDSSSIRFTSETGSSSSSNSENTASRKRIGNRFHKLDTSINDSERAQKSSRRYGTQVDNESSDGSYRFQSNRIVSESDSTLASVENGNHGNQRITTEHLNSHKRIGVRLQNPTTTLHESENVRKSNRRYGIQSGTEILTVENNEDSPNTGKAHTSKTTTVYEVLNGKTLPSSRVVTENITRYYSSKTNLPGEGNVEKLSSEISQLSNSDAHVINKSTISSQNLGDKINMKTTFGVDTSGVSGINSKTTSEETHTSINTSGFTKEDNTLTELAKSENINKQSSQSKLIKELNEEDTINRTSSEQLTNTNIKINEEGNDLSGKSDVRQYYTSGEDDRNTVAALHQGKIKSGNKERTAFVRNKEDKNIFKHRNSGEKSTQQSSTTELNEEEQSVKFEDGDSSTAEKTSEQSISSQSSGTILGSKQVLEEQNGTNTPRRRIVVKKRIYRTRNNNTDGAVADGRVTDFSSSTTNSASGRGSYQQRTKLTLNKNLGYNSANDRNSESSVSKSNLDASENLLHKEIEATKNAIVEKEINTVSGIENTSRRRIQTSRNFGTTNNVRFNTINSARTRINITEENSKVKNVQAKENSEVIENEEHNGVRRRQRIRPTRPFATRTNSPERKSRPNVESDLSSLLAVDKSKWEYLDRTKMAGGGTMVRRRRPLVKTTTEIPSETTKSVNRRIRPVTTTTPSTNSVRQRNQFLNRNRASLTKTDDDTQSDRNALKAETTSDKEEENLNSGVGENILIKNKSVFEDISLSSAQNNLLDKSKTSEESLLVKTSAKGNESLSKLAGNRKITTKYNKLGEDAHEVESNGEILSFEESQNGSFRGRSQNAVKSSTVYTLKTNKGTVLDKSSSSASTTNFRKQTTSTLNKEAERTTTSIPNEEDSTTLIPEMYSYDNVDMTTTEESSTLVPQTTLYDDFIGTTDAATTVQEQTTTESQTTIEPQSTLGTPTTFDMQTTTYSPIITDTQVGIETTTEMDRETTIGTQTTMDATTTIDTPTTLQSETTKDTPTRENFYSTTESFTTMETPITTISDSLTEGNEKLNIGERFTSRTSEKAKNSRSFESTRQQNAFQTENDYPNRQSTSVNRKFGSNSEYSNSQNSEDVQHLRGKDNVEILYHRQKYWETFNKSRSEEGDSPIIYIGTFNNNGYKPGRTGKFSSAEIQKIQEIFQTAQPTESSFSENSKNINRGRTTFSATDIAQNEATKSNKGKEIRLTSTKEYTRTGTLVNDNSNDLTRSQVSKTNFDAEKRFSVDELKTTKFTEIPNIATTEGSEISTTTSLNTQETTVNPDNIGVTTPQITTIIPESISDQTIDFGIIDQETLTSTLSLGEEEPTFPPSPTTTDKTHTNALDKSGLSAFENNLSASTAGFVETTTNSNLFFSEKSQKLAQSSGEISSKLNSDGFSRSRARLSSIQQGSSKRINAAQANEINNLDLNLKVNVSKESTVRSNVVQSNKIKSRAEVLSKTNSIKVNQNSEESTFEEGLQFSGSRYGSNAGRNLRVSNFQGNRRQFTPSSKKKQPNFSAESTQSAVIESATESSTPSETERTTIRSTLIFLKGPRPDGRYAEEHGQDIISKFHRGSSSSSRTEENDEDHSEDLLSRFEEGSKKYSTGSKKTTFFRNEDSLHIATENEHDRDEDVELNVGTDNANEEVSTIRSTLIFLKGPKPFNAGEEVSTTSGIEDSTNLNEETTTDASKQIAPTRRTYVTSNRSKTTYATSDDSSLIRTDQQSEDRRSTSSFRRQQTVRGSSSTGNNRETTENLNISVKSSDDEESGESDLSLNNRGTIRKTYSTINREKIKRPLQSISEVETTSEINEVEETSTISTSTIPPSQQKPTRRRYNPSLLLRSTTTAPQSTTEESGQALETATEKTENVRKYSSFRRKTSSARTSEISSQAESENLKAEVLEDSIGRSSNTDSKVLEDRTETSHENELENNASKNRTTIARRNFSNRFQGNKERTGGQRTSSYASVQVNDVKESDSVSSKRNNAINRSRTAKSNTFDEIKKSEESSTEESSSISPIEGTSEYTTIEAEVDNATTQISNDEASEISTKENVVTQATTTEFEDGSATTEENKDNLSSKTTTIKTEEVESKTLIASEKSSNLNGEQTTATVIEDVNTNLNEKKQSEDNGSKDVTSNIRDRTRLRFNRLKTTDSNNKFENTVNRSSKTIEAVQKQIITSTRQENSESNKYKVAGLRNNIYGINGRRKFTTLRQKQNEEESTTASSVEEGITTDQPESVESDLFASSPSADSLVTESVEATTNSNGNLNEVEQLTTFEDLATLIVSTERNDADENEIALESNFSTTASTETSTKMNDKDGNDEIIATTIEDVFEEATTPTIIEENEEINKTYIANSKQIEKSEDTISKLNTTSTKTSKQLEETTISLKRPYVPGRKFVNTRTRLESATQNGGKTSTDAKTTEKFTTTGRTYSGFNRNRLLLKTNQNVIEETTGSSRVTLNEGSISESRRRYGSSRTKSLQTENSQTETNDQKSAPAFSFSTRTRTKFLNGKNLEKSSNAEQNELSNTQERTILNENEDNSSLSEEIKLENEKLDEEVSKNDEVALNLEEENSTITTSGISEDHTEIADGLQSSQNYSDSTELSEAQIKNTNEIKTTILNNADHFESEINLKSNSSSSVENIEDTKNRLVRPLPYLKNKNILENRKTLIKLAQNTENEEKIHLEERSQDSNDSIAQDLFQEAKDENTLNESLNKVNESEVTSIKQSSKTTSTLKFQRKPFPLSRNLSKTVLEQSINETESAQNTFKENDDEINIDPNQEQSSVTKLSDEITELHANLNEEHTPELLDSTNSTALNVNNSANNGLVREDSNLRNLNNEASNPLKFTRRFQKISSGNRFQINNNQNTESSVRTVNGRRVRVLKFRKPSLNTITDNEGKVNATTQQRPFVRKFFRKRPSATATTVSDTDDSIENSEKQNEAKDSPVRKFRKILVRKTPVFQEDTEDELQELQVNTTKNSLVQTESSDGKTHLLKVQKSSEDLDLTDDLDLQNEFSDTNATSSYNITLNTTETDESNNTSTSGEIEENSFTEAEFNATSIEALEQTSGENITTTESGEQNTDSVDTTASTTTTKNKLFASRRPYKPTKPSISAITSTEGTSITTKTYVRKYSSNFKIPKPPTEVNPNLAPNDENGEVFIRPLSSFTKNRPTYRNKIKTNNDENDEDIDFEDEEVENDDYIERNLQQQLSQNQQEQELFDRNQYNLVQNNREQNDRNQLERDQNDRNQEERDQNVQGQDDRDDFVTDSVEDIRNEEVEPEPVSISAPPVLQSINRFNSKSSGLPNLIIRLNNGFDSQSEKSELEVIPHSSEESTDSFSASYEDEDEANINEESEDEFQSAEKVDLPIPSNTPQVQTTKATPLINQPGFIPKRPQNNKPRVINRPTFTTVHPASLKLRVTSPLASTPPSFKTNNTRSYERKYSPSSTEPTSQDNSLIEDLNINALNARNKKIFEINSRKHTTVKPKPSGGKTNTVESEITTTTTFNISHNDEQINATTNEILNNFDHLQENVLENVISPPTTTRRPPPSTTTTKMTTLYHIFALSAEDDATTENNNPDEFVTNERREKLVEINRVVEVYSKEDKLTKSNKNDAGKIESSELKLEKNATLERLGEIGRVSYVISVESGGSKAKSLEDGRELVIEGRSTVADYTPTEPIPAGSESGPVRNVIPVLDGTDHSEQKKEARKLQLPEVILGVETSTIPLEGLFEAPRKSKELPVSDEPVFAASLGEVYAMKSETSSMSLTVATTNLPSVSTEDTNSLPETTTELPLTTVTEVKTEKPQHYIRPLVPLLRPESNESSPLVISIANLDKVILSKVPRADSSVASSGRISTFVEPPKSINLLDDASLSKVKTATSSSQGRNETVVQTQTSFSSEIQVVRKKLPRRSKSTRRRKSKIDEQRRQNTRRPVLSVRRRITTSSNSSEDSNLQVVDSSTLTPLLVTGNTKYTRRSRPTFSTSTVASPTTTVAADAKSTTNDAAKSTPKVVIRRKFGRPGGGTRRTSTAASALADEPVSTEVPIVTNPLFKRRFTTLTTPISKTEVSSVTSVDEVTTEIGIDFTETTDDVDQEAKDSIQDNKFTNHRYNQIGENLEDDLVDAIKAISNAPIPGVSSTTPKSLNKSTIFKSNGEEVKQPFVRRLGTPSTTTRRPVAQRTQKTKTTVAPKPSTTRVSRRKPKKPEPFERISKDRQFAGRTYRPFTDYDYYDDDDVRIVGKTNSQVKVILHGPGIIECLDQGNFPHPLSCRKFISCAKMETGGVVGWEYTCPKGLSYDPVGGICNWAAGLGSKDEGSPPASQRVVNRISPSLIRRVPAAVKVLTTTLEDLKNKKSEDLANDLRDICNAATSINALKPTVVPNEKQIKIQMMTTSHGNITKTQLSFDDISKLETLNDNNDIVVFVNVWKSNASNENDVVSELESAYKCRGNVTLMVIDLGSIVTDVQTWMALDYIQTGAVISKAINDFVKVSKGSKLHLIGHGMGAHIAGAAGRKYAEISGNLLYRITALDPAMLCYKEPQAISGLQRGDAEFVDVIHSSAYGLGKEEPIGDVDFFPNGPSVLQPGCQDLVCAHNQAIRYFAETIIPGNEKNFISEQCNSIKNLGSNTCKQNQIAMGLSVPRSAKGNYFLKTKDKSPYGLNNDRKQSSNCDRL